MIGPRYHETIGRMRELAERRLRQSVSKVYGPGPNARPFRDGYQTPTHGDIVFYAQHALACCCRLCIRYWHGVPYGRVRTLSSSPARSLRRGGFSKATTSS